MDFKKTYGFKRFAGVAFYFADTLLVQTNGIKRTQQLILILLVQFAILIGQINLAHAQDTPSIDGIGTTRNVQSGENRLEKLKADFDQSALNFTERYRHFFHTFGRVEMPFPLVERDEWERIFASPHVSRPLYSEHTPYDLTSKYSFYIYAINNYSVFYLVARGGFADQDQKVYGPIQREEFYQLDKAKEANPK